MHNFNKATPAPEPAGRQNPSPGVLHLTSVEGAFDEAHDIAFGPHCFIGREEVFPKWQDIQFVEAFPDEASLVLAEENLRGLIDHMLPPITARLNAYHGTSYSVDFWRLIVLPWLIELAQRTWTSFVKLHEVSARCGKKSLTVRVMPGAPEWRFKETAHFRDAMIKDYQFNWWIDSEIATALSPANWRFEFSEATPPPTAPEANDPPVVQTPGKLRGMLRNIKYCLGYSDILGIRWSGVLLAIYVNLLPKSPSQTVFEPSPPGFKPEPYFPRPFLDVFNRLIDATMPESFLDGFPALEQKARRLPYVPGRLRLGALSFWNEQEKVIAAFAREAGEKRIVFQHGGEYGMLKYNLMFNEMEGKYCTFISWGWSFEQPVGGRTIPLPSPFHSKIANRHKRRNDSLIVVGQAIRIHMNRLHWSNRSNLPVWYCKDTINFLGLLDQNVRRSVVFRPYTRIANDIQVRDIVSERFPEIPMLKTGLDNALMKCRLAVLNTFSTTINFTMAANIPTVVYCPPAIMTPRLEAEPFFEPLRKCGVIHDDAKAAARHINQIWGDVEGWWLSAEVQEARKIWNHQYARTDRFWWWRWMKALARLKDVG